MSKGILQENVKKRKFYFQSNSVKNSLQCPKAKSATHSLTELFPIFQNKHWTIKQWEDRTVVPSSHCIILKSVGFYVSDQCSKLDLCGCPKPAEAKKIQLE